MTSHWAIFIDNDSHKSAFIEEVLNHKHMNFKTFTGKKGALFSPLALHAFINKEEQYGNPSFNNEQQPLKTMSSGEQKKALLLHIFEEQPDFIILDNPFDHLDIHFQVELKQVLVQKAEEITFLQLASRKSDLLPFINYFGVLDVDKFTVLNSRKNKDKTSFKSAFTHQIPKPINSIKIKSEYLVEFRNVSVCYGNKPILHQISWNIQKGDFWQLTGKNGSGKTTILSMIFGDNPKAFGQDIYIFGKKKGTGESVWDIKEKIGYFSTNITDKFKGRHTVAHMLISGFTDSVGLYMQPTETQKQKSKEWMLLLNLWKKRNTLFKDLTLGQQRLVMTARAMVKHPPLLILDEPTAGMDDRSATLLVTLVNKIANETNTSIIFVSHRKEPGLLPKSIFKLDMTSSGSKGSVTIT